MHGFYPQPCNGSRQGAVDTSTLRHQCVLRALFVCLLPTVNHHFVQHCLLALSIILPELIFYLNFVCHSLPLPLPNPIPPPKWPRFRDPTSYDYKQVQLNPDDLNDRVNITTLLSAWFAGSLYILQQFSSRHRPRTVHTLIRYGFRCLTLFVLELRLLWSA